MDRETILAGLDSQKVLLATVALISAVFLGGFNSKRRARKYAEATRKYTAVEDLNILRPYLAESSAEKDNVQGERKLGKLVIVGGR